MEQWAIPGLIVLMGLIAFYVGWEFHRRKSTRTTASGRRGAEHLPS